MYCNSEWCDDEDCLSFEEWLEDYLSDLEDVFISEAL